MRKIDADLIALDRPKYEKALCAAAMSLREDRRLLGLIRVRERLEEVCALRAIGSDASIGRAMFEHLSKDAASVSAVQEAQDAAVEAAKRAIQ